jgi:hypothetical protein
LERGAKEGNEVKEEKEGKEGRERKREKKEDVLTRPNSVKKMKRNDGAVI